MTLEAVATMEVAASETEAIDRLRALEELKAACAAAQAREAAQLESLRVHAEADRGVPRAQRGKGLGAEIALARKDSPSRGSRFLGLAKALVREMPHTHAALSHGRISEEAATVLCRETAWLELEHRRTVDEVMAPRLGQAGVRRLAAEARGHAQRLDQVAAAKHLERQQRERRVSVRPTPGGMAYLTALMPLQQAVACYAALQRDAGTIVGAGDDLERSRDQAATDLLVERVTGQAAAAAIPVEIHLVMTDTTLLGDDDAPAWIPGHGPLPAGLARSLIALRPTQGGMTAEDHRERERARVYLRRLFLSPQTGQLAAMESRARLFPPLLRRMVTLRDDVCRTPWCDAPIREVDHVAPHRDGGPTSWQNSSGLCAACNQTKEGTGWLHETDASGLQVTTPTGHRYSASSPPWVTGLSPPEHASPEGTLREYADSSSPARNPPHRLRVDWLWSSPARAA